MKPTAPRLLLLGVAVLAAIGVGAPALAAGPARHRAGNSAVTDPLVLIGIPGLRWTDITARNAPALWRLAGSGSVGSLVVSAVRTRACPADGWLTLNSGARATAQPTAPAAGSARPGSAAPCPPLPRVVPGSAATGEAARIPALPRLVALNERFHYSPDWGLLARAAGPGGCVTAIGPGAALALAGPGGQVGSGGQAGSAAGPGAGGQASSYLPSAAAAGRGGQVGSGGQAGSAAGPGAGGQASSYLPSAAAATRSVLNRCPLTVIDLGALPSGAGPGGATARARAVRAADAAVGRISAEIPANAILTVAGMADDSAPNLRAIIVSGPGYQAGLLAAASTRQPGMVLITDLTPTALGWHGRPVPAAAVGSPVTRADRSSLAAAIRGLVGQDTAAQVYRSTILAFFLAYGFGEGILFGLLALALRGGAEDGRRRRRAAYRVAGVFAGAIPAGTFLASLVPWWLLPHPALLLYAMALGWAALIAAVALAGPWRRDPFGPPGVVAAVTVMVIGLDVMTGSRLQLGTPFGLSALEAGRFYGVGNNALGIYGASGILFAAWVAVAAGRGRFARSRTAVSAGRGRPRLGRAPAAASPASATSVSAAASAATASTRANSAAGPGPTAPESHSGNSAAHPAQFSPAGLSGDSTRSGRGRAVAAAAAVALFTVVASGWPGFGAKVGGTIAMVPAFLLLLAAVAGVRITVRRGTAIGVSGLVLVTGFALLDYFVPATGPSDIGAFVGHVLHGGSGGIVQRKLSANIGSLTTTGYSPIVPAVVIVAALMLAWPAKFRLRSLAAAFEALPLLRPALTAIWLVAVLGWVADDSGVTVAASAIPLALMLVIALVSAVPAGTGRDAAAGPGGPAAGQARGQEGGAAAGQGDGTDASPGNPAGAATWSRRPPGG